MEVKDFVTEVRKKYADEQIKVILDIGSRDGIQSVELAKEYPNAIIYAFEPNPETLGQVNLNTNNYENIKVYGCACGEKNGIIPFYQSTHGNPGSSSVFEKSGKYDYIENYQQKQIEVPMIKLSDLLERNEVERVDLVWADCQGSELAALKGMGKYLDNVLGICTEVEYKEMYKGQPLYPEIKEFLNEKGFLEIDKTMVHDNFFGEAIFIR